jgi:hypothetical protein
LLDFDREEVKRSREFSDFMSQEEWKEKRRNVSRVGKCFHSLKFCETGGGECSTGFKFEEHAAVSSSSILSPYTKTPILIKFPYRSLDESGLGRSTTMSSGLTSPSLEQRSWRWLIALFLTRRTLITWQAMEDRQRDIARIW